MPEHTLSRLKKRFREEGPTAYQVRRDMLDALKKQLSRYQDCFSDAAAQDFGGRPAFESRLIEVIGTTWVVDHARRNLKKWMSPESRWPQMLFSGPNRLRVTYQPKGVVGIIAPWNMPLYLSLGPLTTAIAAGNKAIIKLPEDTPAANQVIKTLLAEIFDDNQVVVFGEELSDPSLFSRQAFDHLIFTGSERVAKSIMADAAKHLTPLTLELGGKSPAIVAEDYDVADAALRITHGKVAMSGQICVAPDYALVPELKVADFRDGVVAAFQRFFPDGVINRAEYCSIINDRQRERVVSMLNDAQEKGAEITVAAPWDGRNRMPLHVLTNVTEDMKVMQEEVFGPLLPVVGYKAPDDVINYVSARPHPLALYLFSRNRKHADWVLSRTQSGGVTINDWGWHVVNAAVPFGGVGASGFGSYHGIEGFRELSNARPVFHRHPAFPTELFHPPVNTGPRGLFQNFWMNLYAGKGDASLGGTPYGE
ncbi:MAG: coniferyl aldehyde dehydrogenase [Pseudomonadales bacterium]|nr:coniferyl aldehyde dehydrogenase [Pseudomonadales bacterium]